MSPADHQAATLRLVPMVGLFDSPMHRNGSGGLVAADHCERPAMGHTREADLASEPDRNEPGQTYRAASQMTADWSMAAQDYSASEVGEDEINAAAAAAYRTSIETGRPLIRTQARPDVRQDLPPLGP